MPDQTTVLHQSTESAPFADPEVIFDSGLIDNNNERRRCKITMVVNTLTPNQDTEPVGYKLLLEVEERVSSTPELWSPVVASPEWNQGFKNVHILELRPGNVNDEGSPQIRDIGASQTMIQREEGVTPRYLRVRVLKRITDATKPDLQTIDCLITLTLFDNVAAA